jgi:hypothetical protein
MPILISAMLLLSLGAIMPASAAGTTTNSDTWFVLAIAGASGSVENFTSTTEHTEVNITWSIMRSPQTAGTVQIGTAKSRMVSDFNNATNTGQAEFKMTLNFTDTNTARNPYGVGTFNVTTTVNVTAMGNSTYGNLHIPADGKGTLVSTSGTGAFSPAKLYGDVVMAPIPVPVSLIPNGWAQGIFFGTHSRVKGTGVIEYYYPVLSATAFTSVSVLPGWTWNFFVHTNGGVGALTYQWYEGSTMLAGQSSMVLSVNKATAGVYNYTCVVADAAGHQVTTNTVRLTVLGYPTKNSENSEKTLPLFFYLSKT